MGLCCLRGRRLGWWSWGMGQPCVGKCVTLVFGASIVGLVLVPGESASFAVKKVGGRG